MMPAWNGGATPGFWRAMAIETEKDPAEWPCNTKVSYDVMAHISEGQYTP